MTTPLPLVQVLKREKVEVMLVRVITKMVDHPRHAFCFTLKLKGKRNRLLFNCDTQYDAPSLPLSLIHLLTHSFTHSLIPSLTHSSPHSPHSWVTVLSTFTHHSPTHSDSLIHIIQWVTQLTHTHTRTHTHNSSQRTPHHLCRGHPLSERNES